MKKILSALMILIMLAGCSGGRPTPDWTLKGFSRLVDFKKNYLEGNTRMADLHFNKALDEIKKSGDLDLLARAYLIRMAMEVAVLEQPRDGAFLKVDAAQPDPAHETFHAFLTGQHRRIQQELLPAQYRGVFKRLSLKTPEGMAHELAGIEDPASRLIAAGVCVGLGRVDEGLLITAAETASRNGWKKTLIAYLERQRAFYTENNQRDKAQAVSQRILLIGDIHE